jgi:hypothetical protein
MSFPLSLREILQPNGDPATRMARLRWVFAVAALAILGLFLASGFWFIDLQLGNGYAVQANVGTVRVGVVRSECSCEDPPAPNLTFTEGFDGLYGAAAWRPFHADNGYSNAIVFPLWQPLLACIAIAAYCHGYLRGRRGDPAHCRDCGYLLRGLPIIDSRRTCPECGRDNDVGALKTAWIRPTNL